MVDYDKRFGQHCLLLALKDCRKEAGVAVLQKLVPALYQLMDQHGHHLEWPSIPYPRVGSDLHTEVDRLH